MTVWPVYVESWQQECCGEDFAVGDAVAWHLALRPGMAGFDDFEVEPGQADVVRVHQSGGGREALELRWAGLHAWWEGPVGRRRGVLVEEHHADEAASVPTAGVVQRVRAARVPARGPVQLSLVAGTAAPRPWHGVDGWLVDLVVEP